MTTWESCATVDECPPGVGIERVIAGRIVAIFNVAGKFYALDGICPHQGGPLGQGQLQGPTVTCPWHGWQFDVTTGVSETISQVCQRCLPIKVEDGKLLVGLVSSQVEKSGKRPKDL